MKRLIKGLSPQNIASRRILTSANRARDNADWPTAAGLYEIYLSDPAASLAGAIWVQLGHARKEAGNAAGAIDAYKRAIEILPEVADTFLHLGHLLYRSGAVSDGLDALREAVRLEPNLRDAQVALAEFTERAGDFESNTSLLPPVQVDEDWYAWRYPDVERSGLRPALHYARFGVGLNYMPAPSVAPSAANLQSTPHEPWRTPGGEAWSWSFAARLQQRLAALPGMNLDGPFVGEITFSVATATYNTKPTFLIELARSIVDQAFKSFEWIIWDNGSTDPRTLAALDEVAAMDPRFKLHRSERNLHIIGGNRATLDLATGRYYISVDHDDVLYPDSLALFANVLRSATTLPDIIFSDEQKITETGEPFELMWRSPFSRASAAETVPAAHLMAISTAKAREANLYSDDYAQGSHDWDSWLRLTELDVHVVHVPEVLYGWRIHALSTAGSSDAKDYINTSQTAVVERSLQRRKLDNLFEISTLFQSSGWYRANRVPKSASPCQIDFIVGEELAELPRLAHNLAMVPLHIGRIRILFPKFRAQAIAALRQSRAADGYEWVGYTDEAQLKAELVYCGPSEFAKLIVSSKVRIRRNDALWDAIGTLELDRNAGLVSGPMLSANDIVLNAGYLAGLEGGIATPFAGWHKADIPGDLWELHRSITIAPMLFVAIRTQALRTVGAIGGIDIDDALFGLDFCLRLVEAGYGVVQSPKMEAERDQIMARVVGEGSDAGSDQVKAALASGLLRHTLSSHLSRRANRFGEIARLDEQASSATVDRVDANAAIPFNLVIDPRLSARPTINFLLPVIRMSSMSGGPNTALNLAYRLAELGFPLRLFSTDSTGDEDHGPIWAHIRAISGVDKRLPHVEIVNAAVDRSKPYPVGANDVFFATAWWTAQIAKHASALLGNRPFIYLVQDFEPLFYASSTPYALALETYELDHIPVINTSLLRDYLAAKAVGRYAERGFVDRALVFEPAIDRASFFPEQHGRDRRRLLFYARPSHPRNLFPIGVAALRHAIDRGILSPLHWDFIGMGETFEPIDLGYGATLTCAPWLGFDDYAGEMRQADLLLSLMMSPHPSYPPLEMGACSGMVVTNVFENKTAERMAGFSDRIIAVEPNIEAVAEGLKQAARRVGQPVTQRQDKNTERLPDSWDESFAAIVPELGRRLIALGLKTDGLTQSLANLPIPGVGQDDMLGSFLAHAATRRATLCAADQVPGLLSFATILWNTAPDMLEVLARSLRDQLGGTVFEWFVLDNGSTDPSTLAAIERLKSLPFVRFERSSTNLGIIGGTRRCLESVTSRYMVPLDHDDYVLPDAARVMTWYLQKHDFPAMVYSDEALLDGDRFVMPYIKPDWDPVLFVNSCYIAHLCAIDRQLALSVDAYADRAAEASPDWDTFTRLALAGHTPVHVPELLYGWRIHEQSTAGNMKSKPYVAKSQQAVLQRFLDAQPARARFTIEASPLFSANADWWFRRKRTAPRAITTIIVARSSEDKHHPDIRLASGIDHHVVRTDLVTPLAALLPHLRRCVAERRLVHILATETRPDDDEWAWEAMGLFELFPDTVLVGGRLHSYGHILAGSFYFGFGLGCDSPDKGHLLAGNAGYFCQLWKPHSVDAVSAQHCVFDAAFLVRLIETTLDASPPMAAVGQWAGTVAREEDRRVIYSPFLSAETDIDWLAYIGDGDQRRANQASARYMDGSGLMSPNLGLAAETAFLPTIRPDRVLSRSAIPLPPYPEWFPAHVLRRAGDYPIPLQGIVFSILTPLYSGSDPGLFVRTVESVAGQTYGQFEWVIVAQGPITPALDQVLRGLRDARIRVLRLAENRGIIGGMRYGLEMATGAYVLPLDGDDLITLDCLQVMAATIDACSEQPAYLYSDEDIVTGDALHDPLLRPDWDPVLDLENSWIWHVGLFRRDLGVSLGVFTDKGSEYCQDWDTVYRFTRAGHAPLHVHEVLYHWRSHPQSTSNRVDAGSASSQSSLNLLTRKINDKGLQDRCEVLPYPIYRGTTEWWVSRTPTALPRIRCLMLDLEQGVLPRLPGPLQADWHLIEAGPALFDAMAAKVAALEPQALVVLVSAAVVLDGFEGVLDAIKQFDFHDDVVAVSGRLIQGDTEAARGLVTDSSGRLWAPFADTPLTDAGPFAIRWKPVSISVPILDICVLRADFLGAALESRLGGCSIAEFGLWLGAFASARRQRIAFTPLLSADLRGKVVRSRDQRLDQLCWDSFRAAQSSSALQCDSTGPAAYMSKTFAD